MGIRYLELADNIRLSYRLTEIHKRPIGMRTFYIAIAWRVPFIVAAHPSSVKNFIQHFHRIQTVVFVVVVPVPIQISLIVPPAVVHLERRVPPHQVVVVAMAKEPPKYVFRMVVNFTNNRTGSHNRGIGIHQR